MSDFKKKVTKIIRKDGISYRQAGGSQISYDPNEDTATKEVQGLIVMIYNISTAL